MGRGGAGHHRPPSGMALEPAVQASPGRGRRGRVGPRHALRAWYMVACDDREMADRARGRGEAMRQLADLRRRLAAAEDALADALATMKRAEEEFDAANDRFTAAESAWTRRVRTAPRRGGHGMPPGKPTARPAPRRTGCSGGCGIWPNAWTRPSERPPSTARSYTCSNRAGGGAAAGLVVLSGTVRERALGCQPCSLPKRKCE
jgi:hypothetical protein